MKKWNIGWGLTTRCNMDCDFCYSKDVRIEPNDLCLSDWIRFIDDNHEYINSINYGTGENSIHDDFFEIISYIRGHYPQITQSVTTNGFLFERVKTTPRYRDIYLECIDEVDISLDFAKATLHNDFRNNSRAFEWALKGLEILQTDDKLSTLVFIATPQTLVEENIRGLFAISASYGSLVRMNIYRPVSGFEQTNNKFVVPYKVLKNALEYICDNYEVIGLSDILFGNLYTKEKDIFESTGVNSLRILPDGTISPSTYLITEEFKNEYHISHQNILKNITFNNIIKPKYPIECKGCLIEKTCRGGVYDRRFLWYGTLRERDPYCPLRNGDELPSKVYNYTKQGRITIHDGYLPTLFFRGK